MSTIDKIQELLKEKGLSQKALTDYLEIDKSTFTQWKKGKSHSYQKYIGKIADFLGTSPSDLMDWQPEEHNPIQFKFLTNNLMTYDRDKIIEAIESAIFKCDFDDNVLHQSAEINQLIFSKYEIIAYFEKLNEFGKKKALEYLIDLSEQDKYTN